MIVQHRYPLIMTFISIGIILVFNACQKEIGEADLILSNGVFFTVNPEQPEADAVAIKGDRILAVGTYAEINEYRSNRTRILDLQGRFACPGFNDSHVRLLDAGLAKRELDVSGAETVRQVRTILRNKIGSLPSVEWIVGRGWDQDVLLDGKWPDKHMLDRVAFSWPVYLTRKCGNVAWVNSRALLISNITAETRNPPGGEIVKDPRTGKPTGILKGTAMELVAQYIPPPSQNDIRSSIKRVIREVAEHGLTTVQDNSLPVALDLYQELLDKGELTCRITKQFPYDLEQDTFHQLGEKLQNPRLRRGALFVPLDGSIASKTAVFIQPYFDNPAERGILHINQEELEDLFYFADSRQYPISVGAFGDAASHMFFNALERSQKVNRSTNRRHRLEYAQIVRPEDILKIKTLDVVVSVQPFHCIDDMRWLEARIGPARCQNAHLWRSLKNQGINLALGSDWPYGPVNPMLGLYAAVTRRDTLGHPLEGWFPKERLTIEEAIEAYTLGSAYAEFMEDEKGSLEPGKLADIVVIDRNLLEIASEEIRKAKITYTILGGEIVYENGVSSYQQ